MIWDPVMRRYIYSVIFHINKYEKREREEREEREERDT